MKRGGPKLFKYELVQYEGYSYPRKYKIYILTEEEAHYKNQAFSLNRVTKRFVKLDDK
jgi:hypothetical protein